MSVPAPGNVVILTASNVFAGMLFGGLLSFGSLNPKLASLNTSADYELAKNLRMTLNGTVQRLWHVYLPEESFLSYALGTNLTFQF